MSAPQFKVYSSSAGSGKTYTLTREYLKLALQSDSPFYFRRILAITFTNDAANEMKARILGALRHFADEGLGSPAERAASDRLLDSVADELASAGNAVSHDTLRHRARQTYHHLLHQYSDFAVCTIDSFVNRLVSAFSEELDLPFNYEIDLDQRALLDAAVDRLLARVGPGQHAALTEAMVAFVLEKTEAGKNWNNLAEDLSEYGKNLFREQVVTATEDIHHLDVRQVLDIRQQLHAHNAGLEATLRAHAQRAVALMQENGLGGADFFHSSAGIGVYFEKWADGKRAVEEGPNSYVQTTVREDKWYTVKGKKGLPAHDLIEAIKGQLSDCFHALEAAREAAAGQHRLYASVLPALYPLSVLNQLRTEVEAIQRERNALYIANFNRLILKVVMHEPVPFIYERLGERYNHLLIDEFQDTSVLQWTNLLPLIENSLGGGHFNLVVGDAKQAIYRWRAGEMEQIVHLHQQEPHRLMALLRAPNPLVEERYDNIAPYLTPDRLQTNYRSAAEIIAFNNDFFTSVACSPRNQDNPLLAAIYGEGFAQDCPPGVRTGGHVAVSFLGAPPPGSEAADLLTDAPPPTYEACTLEATVAAIAEAEAAGYARRDIAVLCRTNARGRQVANFLRAHPNRYEIVSADLLGLSSSEAVNLLVALLRVMNAPTNRLAKYEALYLFHRTVRQELPDEAVTDHLRNAVESGRTDRFYDHFAHYGYPLAADTLPHAGLYEATEQLIAAFRLFDLPRQAEYLFGFLDTVLNFCVEESSQLATFLTYWDQQKDKLSISPPAHRNALTITTVHKAKGLEYPVVIVPFADWSTHPHPRTDLWADLSGEAFADFAELTLPGPGHAPRTLATASVLMSEGLKNTPLGEQYEREKQRTFIENLNALYVAFTRPTDRLYVLARHPKAAKRPQPDTVSGLLYEYLQTNGAWQDDRAAYVLSAGAPRAPAPAPPEAPTYALRRVVSHDRSQSVQLSRSAGRLFDLESFAPEKDASHRLRDALARLRHAADVGRVVSQLLGEGLLDHPEASQLTSQLAALLAHRTLHPLFAEGLRVELGREILWRNQLLTPDRVVWHGEAVVILDFYAEAPAPTHAALMRQYAELFGQMGVAHVQLWLVYVADGTVVAA